MFALVQRRPICPGIETCPSRLREILRISGSVTGIIWIVHQTTRTLEWESLAFSRAVYSPQVERGVGMTSRDDANAESKTAA